MIDQKDEIIIKASKALAIPADHVEKIFSFQFKDVTEQTKTCNSIEITGLGRLFTTENKIHERINSLTVAIWKYNEKLETASGAKATTLNRQIETALEQIQVLLKKLGNES